VNSAWSAQALFAPSMAAADRFDTRSYATIFVRAHGRASIDTVEAMWLNRNEQIGGRHVFSVHRSALAENTTMAGKQVGRVRTLARDMGAKEAKIIDAKSVVTAAWVRFKCQFGCGGYGATLTCPPYSPTPEQTQATIDCFNKALLIHGDKHTRISKIAVALERELFLAGYYKAFAFGSGPCRLCRSCDVTKSCKNPSLARPSMEAAGIDVYQTARNNGFHIEVVTSYECEQNYFGLVLIE